MFFCQEAFFLNYVFFQLKHDKGVLCLYSLYLLIHFDKLVISMKIHCNNNYFSGKTFILVLIGLYSIGILSKEPINLCYNVLKVYSWFRYPFNVNKICQSCWLSQQQQDMTSKVRPRYSFIPLNARKLIIKTALSQRSTLLI